MARLINKAVVVCFREKMDSINYNNDLYNLIYSAYNRCTQVYSVYTGIFTIPQEYESKTRGDLSEKATEKATRSARRVRKAAKRAERNVYLLQWRLYSKRCIANYIVEAGGFRTLGHTSAIQLPFRKRWAKKAEQEKAIESGWPGKTRQ